jgi:hypothetical protein
MTTPSSTASHPHGVSEGGPPSLLTPQISGETNLSWNWNSLSLPTGKQSSYENALLWTNSFLTHTNRLEETLACRFGRHGGALNGGESCWTDLESVLPSLILIVPFEGAFPLSAFIQTAPISIGVAHR